MTVLVVVLSIVFPPAGILSAWLMILLMVDLALVMNHLLNLAIRSLRTLYFTAYYVQMSRLNPKFNVSQKTLES